MIKFWFQKGHGELNVVSCACAWMGECVTPPMASAHVLQDGPWPIVLPPVHHHTTAIDAWNNACVNMTPGATTWTAHARAQPGGKRSFVTWRVMKDTTDPDVLLCADVKIMLHVVLPMGLVNVARVLLEHTASKNALVSTGLYQYMSDYYASHYQLKHDENITGYLKNHWTKHRLVCIHSGVFWLFSMQILNLVTYFKIVIFFFQNFLKNKGTELDFRTAMWS